ncbi:MAG: phenylalanine--tRNA ligase subunit beta, partial [Parachlamydiaceae bacterium]
DLKGIIENFLESLGIARVSYRPSKLPSLHPGRQAAIYSGNLEVGSFGEIHPQVARRLDVPTRILFAELNLYDLFKSRKKEVKMKKLPEFPASERDWTITLREEAPVNQVIDAIKSIPSQLLEDVYLSDMYRSATIGPNKKNATFHFVYRDNTKTIEQIAVDNEHARLTENALHLIAGCL